MERRGPSVDTVEFPSRADRLAAYGTMLEAAGAIASIIVAVLAVESALNLPRVVSGLLRASGFAAIIASARALNDMVAIQNMSWRDRSVLGSYGILLAAVLTLGALFILVAFPGISPWIAEQFEMPLPAPSEP